MVKNILIVGVGGQGTILASRILSQVALSTGQDVKVSEIHGMSQRGGSVVTQVRFGDKVYSPIIEPGTADMIMAFEKLEALRWLHWLKEDGQIIVNDQKMNPMPVVTGVAKYPDDVLEQIRSKCKNVLIFDALHAARDCGSDKAANVVLLGALSKYMNIDRETWITVITKLVPQKFLQVNLDAFAAGEALTEK